MTEEQLNVMIADIETYVYFKQKKINQLIEEKEIISVEDTAQILRYFSNSLLKVSNLLGKVMEIGSRDRLGEVLEISLSTLAWIVYTFPSLEVYTNLFPENFILRDKDILDFLAYNMMELENIVSNPSTLKSFSLDIADNLKEASALFGYLSDMSTKGLDFS